MAAKDALQQMLRARAAPVVNEENEFRAQPADDRIPSAAQALPQVAAADEKSIAVIGMSGRFPGADSIDDFWANLQQGRSSIAAAPVDRGWDIADYYDAHPQTPGKTYSTQGAYLADVAMFDCRFFGISPREAERMDPSERIFLQESWRAIENAGYSPAAIGGQKWGVFACAKGDYAARIQQQDTTYHSSTDSIAASRLSYLLNLVGPAVAVDTACSSTLAAIAYACDSLMIGNCDVAVAGGGGIYTTPNMLITASQASLFSPTGRTYAFDSRADGIVLGEAIGSLVLKPLSRAVAAGDPIWGVIKGWGTNQDGKTNGITAPNANAQARLQADIYRKFGVDPARITLLEAHGTGTKLGDPIEVQALTASFRGFTTACGYCALGSVKPNIGHAFFGAGVAGVIKVLLCMRHRQIPPSVNFQQINPHIQLDGSPFFINTQLRAWNVNPDGGRCAAVSSFGATGINVHLVVQEYERAGEESSQGTSEPENTEQHACLVPLSARTPEQLREYVRDFKKFVVARIRESSRRPHETLKNIAYTLQVARQPLAARLAVVTHSMEELAEGLERYLSGQSHTDGMFFGARREARSSALAATEEGESEANVQSWIEARQLSRIAQAWAKGVNLDWAKLYRAVSQSSRPRRVHLPGYTFAKDRHWITVDPTPRDFAAAAGATIHPLLHRNTSSPNQQRFSSRFTGEEFFLDEHRVQGNRVLPGVAYLEMVRAAMSASVDDAMRLANPAPVISNVVWVQPYIFSAEASELHIELYAGAGSVDAPAFEFEVYSEGDGRTVHCQGKVCLTAQSDGPMLDLASILQEVTATDLVARDCYAKFSRLGFELGPKLQGLSEVFRGTNQVLAKLRLPTAMSGGSRAQRNAFVLHPTLMDSALQACIGFSVATTTGYSFALDKPALPFVLERMEVFHACAGSMWVWIRVHADSSAEDKVQRFDIDLCEESGRVCVRLLGFSSSALRHELVPGGSRPQGAVESLSPDSDVAILQPTWLACSSGRPERIENRAERYVVLCELLNLDVDEIKSDLRGSTVVRMCSEEAEAGLRFIDHATQLFELVKEVLQTSNAAHRILIQVVAPRDADGWLLNAIAGVLTTMHLERPGAAGQLILVDVAAGPEAIVDALEEDSSCVRDAVVRYRNGVREVLAWEELPDQIGHARAPWKKGGVYLITQGLGSGGKVFAAQILRAAPDAKLILVGRSALDATKRAALEELKGTSGHVRGHVEYRQLDVCDLPATKALVTDVVREWGSLQGVIHCADPFPGARITKETVGEFARAMAPAVLGTTHLDSACAELEIDLFVLFSSGTGAMGHLRPADCSTGHAFMGEFAQRRNRLVALGRRSGHTLSVNWSLWQDAGMPVDSEYQNLLRHNTGRVPLQSRSGLAAFYAAFDTRKNQVMVLAGDLTTIRRTIGKSWLSARRTVAAVEPRQRNPQPQAAQRLAVDADMLRERIERVLIQAIAGVNKLPVADIDVDADLGELGFDSISLTSLGDVLNREYPLDLLPTLFFEYPTVAKFTGYLLSEHSEVFRAAWGLNQDADDRVGSGPAKADVVESSRPQSRAPTIVQQDEPHRAALRSRTAEPIAIVGMCGRFPQARNVTELWENLSAGKDCIEEVPVARWDWRAIFGDPRTEPEKTNIKWGGFIEAVDEFDPLFFNMTPRDAEQLDPQHRLLMMYVWAVVEDAGYAGRDLAGTNTAIYVGTAGDMGYNDLVARATQADYAPPPVSMAPNRMSYFLDLHGPSEPIETACSSSLVAVHRGVEAIRSGRSDVAIVGGVQTIVTPCKHISFSRAGLLAEDGRCKAFSAHANGFVRGEGVGMLMLKRLSAAEAAHDHIYGVILGSAENHGGRASSFTAPNPHAQAELLKMAYAQAGVDPASVTYIEAHGTGTELGDPIEVNGLKMAFRDLLQGSKHSQKKGFCGLGSVKTNIGHLELAAGVAGVIKVLLQMKHKTLVKSLHSEEINPYIQLEDSPFYVVHEAQAWESLRDSFDQPIPRRAGVSSFGIGGANAHVVLEEYVADPNAMAIPPTAADRSGQAVVLLSAKAPDRLRDSAYNLLAFVRNRAAGLDLRDLAYTLQVGRDAMDERLGLIVTSLADLEIKLQAYVSYCDAAAKELPADLHRGHAKRNRDVLKGLEAEELGGLVEKWMRRGQLAKLVDLWVNGLTVDWNRLYPHAKPSRISLPTYPFEPERYWVAASPRGADHGVATRLDVSLHPLLHRNTSDLSGLSFTSTFCGREFFLADHVVRKIKVMPGAAHLEMARAAVDHLSGSLAESDKVIRLRNVAWVRPINVVDGERTVHIALAASPAEHAQQIQFEIHTDPDTDDGAALIHCQGLAEVVDRSPAPTVKLDELRSTPMRNLSGAEVYELYRAMGIDYGPSHQGVVSIYVHENQALGRLRLPASVMSQRHLYSLHPALVDSALQVSLALSLDAEPATSIAPSSLRPVLPFALEQLDQYSPCTESMWAWVRFSDGVAASFKREPSKALLKVDIDLCDEQGKVCVRLTGLTSRVLPNELEATDARSESGALIAAPHWKNKPVTQRSPASESSQSGARWVLLLERDAADVREIENRLPACTCLHIHSAKHSAQRFVDFAIQAFSTLQEVQKSVRERPPSDDQVLIQLVVSADETQPQIMALAGLLRTMSLENPRYMGQLIAMPRACGTVTLCERLAQDGQAIHDRQIRYVEDSRQVLAWQELAAPARVSIPWKNGGTYLITGGMGGLGRVLAREILLQTDGSTVVLVGRTSPAQIEGELQALRSGTFNGTVDYRSVDVCDSEQMQRLIDGVIARYGSLQGVIHAAGVIQDSFLIKKTVDEFTAVLSPKVTGTACLDQATKDVGLDFFVLFSSAAAPLGNFGQADYAIANAFMDEFARHRNSLVATGVRSGHTLSVNWPLWQEGGMRIDAVSDEWARKRFGLASMPTWMGMQVLYSGLESGRAQILALYGERSRLGKLLDENPAPDEPLVALEKSQPLPVGGNEDFEEGARAYLARLLSTTLKIPAQKIRADEPMEKFGIDSIVVMGLTNQLEAHFGSLSKTLFFEYQTIAELARYFMHAHADRMRELLKMARPAASAASLEAPRELTTSPARRARRSLEIAARGPIAHVESSARAPSGLNIAIIGLSGRYPRAIDLAEYWDNLCKGKNCVAEIPSDRWDWQKYYDPDLRRAGAHYSRWGGFIDGMDEFDPLFFNISPREAEYMDPQERLFLAHAWTAVEDAGYTRAAFKGGSTDHNESLFCDSVGVYAGVMYVEYQLYGAEQTLQGNPLSLSGSAATVANRVSYIMGLHGPSLTVDTMCSSSLTAIHLACQDLKAGRVALAIAGGVNLTVHPNKYLMLSGGRFISTNGKCESFGAGGDGYIPGEGVGVVVLKRLADAQSAGDHIYAVIKGSSINHGGRTHGYSVPNPVAQQASIAAALREAQIDPRCISYVEAHGTGTKLGDPIEITGLTNAFSLQSRHELKSEGQYCWIGSAKSNIGHCESAAGIAGLTKVLLQMKHGKIAPSLHAQVLNPNIDFASTPFEVNQELREWVRPVLKDKDGISRTYPRIAGVSSFGAGGSNAHLLVEEYVPASQPRREEASGPYIVPLSAQTPEQLRAYAQRLSTFVEATLSMHADAAVRLDDLCYTLQVGREAMHERLALIVYSMTDLRDKLSSYLTSPNDVDDLHRGRVNESGLTLAALSDDADMRQAIQTWVEKRKYAKLLELWVNGSSLDWNLFYGAVKPARIGLPTYPFARERYWIPNELIEAPGRSDSPLHPLLHRNTSQLGQQRFSSTFSGEEFFLADHVIGTDRVLPGVVYLEMVRAGVQQALGFEPERNMHVVLEHIVWVQPAIVRSAQEIHVTLYSDESAANVEEQIHFEIYTLGAGNPAQEIVHAQGIARLDESLQAEDLDLAQLRSRMTAGRISGSDCYERFKSVGIHYGLQHQGLVELHLGDDQSLAQIRLPAPLVRDSGRYVMHPSMLDAALQSCFGLSIQEGSVDAGEQRAYLPYAMEKVEVYSSCEQDMWAWVRRSEQGPGSAANALRKVDVDLCNARGIVCVRIEGLTSRALADDSIGAVLAVPQWREVSAPEMVEDAAILAEHWIVLCEMPAGQARDLEALIPGSRCRQLESSESSLEARYGDYATRVFEQIKEIAGRKPRAGADVGKILIQLVMPNGAQHSLLRGISGLLNTAQLEIPRIVGQTLSVDVQADAARLSTLLMANRQRAHDGQVRCAAGKRFIYSWQELASSQVNADAPWRSGGVYLVTGGLGGLGRLFIRDILDKAANTTVVLTGRSLPDIRLERAIEQLQAAGRSKGHQVVYLQADVSESQATLRVIELIVAQYGSLRGILHSAGVTSGGFIIKKSAAEFRRMLAAKVAGTVHLDHSTRHLDLDFFVLFSSSSSVTGAVGQADYAAANGFMDQFAQYRNELVAAGQRFGRSLSINWPLWDEGGMQADSQTIDMMRSMLGLVPMKTNTGIRALYAALASGHGQVLVQEGYTRRIRSTLFAQPAVVSHSAYDMDAIDGMSEDAIDAALSDLLEPRKFGAVKHSIQRSAASGEAVNGELS